MKVEINQKEINAAISAYMPILGVDIEGKNVEVALQAGRGNNGMSATVDITIPTPISAPAQIHTVEPVTKASIAEPVIEPEVTPEAEVEDSEASEPASSTSLFD